MDYQNVRRIVGNKITFKGTIFYVYEILNQYLRLSGVKGKKVL